MPNSIKRELNIDQLAEVMNLSLKTIRKYQKMGMPYTRGTSKNNRSQYNADEVAAWMRANNLTGDGHLLDTHDSAAVVGFLIGYKQNGRPIVVVGSPGASIPFPAHIYREALEDNAPNYPLIGYEWREWVWVPDANSGMGEWENLPGLGRYGMVAGTLQEPGGPSGSTVLVSNPDQISGTLATHIWLTTPNTLAAVHTEALMWETVDSNGDKEYSFLTLGSGGFGGINVSLCKEDDTLDDNNPVQLLTFGPGFVGTVTGGEANIGLNITGGQNMQVTLPNGACGPATVDWLGFLLNGNTTLAVTFDAKFNVTHNGNLATVDLPFVEGDGITIDIQNPGVKISWDGMTVNESTGVTDIEFDPDDFDVTINGAIANVAWGGLTFDGKSGVKTIDLDPDFLYTDGSAPTVTLKWWGVRIYGYANPDFSGTITSTSFGFGDEFYIGNQTSTYPVINLAIYNGTGIKVEKQAGIGYTISLDAELNDLKDVSVSTFPNTGALFYFDGSKWKDTGAPGSGKIPQWSNGSWGFVDLPSGGTVNGDGTWISTSTTGNTTTVSHIGLSTSTQSVAVITGLSVSGKDTDCYDPWSISYTVTNLNFDAHGHFVNTTTGTGGTL